MGYLGIRFVEASNYSSPARLGGLWVWFLVPNSSKFVVWQRELRSEGVLLSMTLIYYLALRFIERSFR